MRESSLDNEENIFAVKRFNCYFTLFCFTCYILYIWKYFVNFSHFDQNRQKCTASLFRPPPALNLLIHFYCIFQAPRLLKPPPFPLRELTEAKQKLLAHFFSWKICSFVSSVLVGNQQLLNILSVFHRSCKITVFYYIIILLAAPVQ